MSIYMPTADDLRVDQETVKVKAKSPSKGGPVLMADCTTPVAGETLLSLLWKRWEQDG